MTGRGSTGGAVPSTPLAHLRSIMEPTRGLVNDLGSYFAARPVEAIPVIDESVRGLSPYAWPRCLRCGGSVNDCDDYDPDMSGPLWSPKQEQNNG